LQIISRVEAKALGLKTFFTGKACRRGHIAERYVSSPSCVECKKDDAASFYEQNREKRLSQCAEWRSANKGRKQATNKAWYEANKERQRAATKKCTEAKKDEYAATARAWQRANRGKRRAIETRYRENHPEQDRSKVRNRRAAF
jgi:hypothetical protein